MKTLHAGYVHLEFAFQMRSRLKYKQRENKVLKEILVSTTLQSHYFLHLMKSAFASRHFWCFDCQSRILHFAIWLLFLLVSFDWCVGQNAPWMNQNCFVVTWLMTYVCLHILHPHRKKKIHKKVVEYSTDRPSTHLRRKFNWFQLSAFLQEKKLNSLLLSANERAEIFATCRHWFDPWFDPTVHRITPFRSEALVSSPNLVLPACSLALDDSYSY